jgi:flagellar assembly factor FliW
MDNTLKIVKFVSSHFGNVEIPEDKVISVPEGIIGFPDHHRYALLDPSGGGSQFLWLQSIDEPDLAFIVTNPLLFVPDYQIQGSEPALERLEIGKRQPPALFVIVTVPRDEPDSVSINLLAPILYFSAENELFQVDLEKGNWPLKLYLLQQGSENPDSPSSETGKEARG